MSDMTFEKRPADPVGRFLFSSSYYLALVGGILMALVSMMVVISVTGRYLFSAPIYGDFELAAMATAVAVALFLPYCHVKRGNVVVDLFLSWAPEAAQRFLDGLGNIVLTAISGLLTWQLWQGMGDTYSSLETTMILGFAIWWAFPLITLSFCLLTLCAAYAAYEDFTEAFR